MTTKLYYVKSWHNGRATIYQGTLEYLCTRVFGYTLECGHSWNRRIPERPKSLKSLVKALSDSAYECCRYHDSYDASTEEEFNSGKYSISAMRD